MKCIDCQEPPRNGRSGYCERCRARRKGIQIRQYDRLAAAHLCLQCRKPNDRHPSPRCRPCQDRFNLLQNARKAARREAA